MFINKENRLVLEFNSHADFDEIKVVTGLYRKLAVKSNKPGFIKDFDPNEVELIRAIDTFLTPSSDTIKP